MAWLLIIAALAGGAYWRREAVMSIIGWAGNASAEKNGRGGAGARGGRAEVPVRFARLERIAIQRQVDLSGTLAALDQTRVSSEVAGVIRDLNMELGQEVTAGQVLIQLDTRELELARARAESSLRQIEAQLGIVSGSLNGPETPVMPADDQVAAVRTATANRDDARAQFKRADELYSKGLIPRADHETSQTRLKVAEAALQSAIENVHASKATIEDRRASYQLAQKKLEDATIRAPMGGSISERLVARGEYIRENTQVATIVQTQMLKLRTAVQERYANLIRPGLRVQFRVEPYPDRLFEGKIANISPAIDQDSRTFPVEVLVDNAQNRLKPGLFATGSILTHRDMSVLAVPEDAVSILAGVSSVYIIENGVIKQQSVTLGAQEGRFYEVIDGLEGSETLAASNLSQLVSGDRVSEARMEANTTTPPVIGDTGSGRGGSGRGDGVRGERERGGAR
ncbi:MAG TPA: efflux RND transporter periplasmic adaptor subunit [Terriglobia bacterium]|nr:efflux RND transporter periplasmic adaptor subunit [Terriglobia bacterium]